MHDPFFMRGFEGQRDLTRDRERFVQRQRPGGQPIGQRAARHQLEHQELVGPALLESVNRGNIRMIERGEHARFTLETGEALAVSGKGIGQRLDGDLAAETRVAGPVDLAHSAGPKQRVDFVGAEAGPPGQAHNAIRVLSFAGGASATRVLCTGVGPNQRPEAGHRHVGPGGRQVRSNPLQALIEQTVEIPTPGGEFSRQPAFEAVRGNREHVFTPTRAFRIESSINPNFASSSNRAPRTNSTRARRSPPERATP